MFTDNTDGGLGPGMTRYLRELGVFVCLRSFFLRILAFLCVHAVPGLLQRVLLLSAGGNYRSSEDESQYILDLSSLLQ